MAMTKESKMVMTKESKSNNKNKIKIKTKLYNLATQRTKEHTKKKKKKKKRAPSPFYSQHLKFREEKTSVENQLPFQILTLTLTLILTSNPRYIVPKYKGFYLTQI